MGIAVNLFGLGMTFNKAAYFNVYFLYTINAMYSLHGPALCSEC